MKTMTIKKMALVLGILCSSAITAHATSLPISSDLNPAPNAEQYQFSTQLSGTGSFSDVVNFSAVPFRNLSASVSGTEQNYITFSTFDLYSSATNSLIAVGTVGSFGTIAFGGVTSGSLGGDYFLKIIGTNSGEGLNSGSYNGNITMTAAVPEPESYAMFLSGIGLMGFIARRRSKNLYS